MTLASRGRRGGHRRWREGGEFEEGGGAEVVVRG